MKTLQSIKISQLNLADIVRAIYLRSRHKLASRDCTLALYAFDNSITFLSTVSYLSGQIADCQVNKKNVDKSQKK